MGMFDTVHFTCPNCKKQFEEQSKSGDCHLKNYHQDSVPADVVAGLGDSKSRLYCYHCKHQFEISAPQMQRVKLVLLPIDDEGNRAPGGYD